MGSFFWQVARGIRLIWGFFILPCVCLVLLVVALVALTAGATADLSVAGRVLWGVMGVVAFTFAFCLIGTIQADSLNQKGH